MLFSSSGQNRVNQYFCSFITAYDLNDNILRAYTLFDFGCLKIPDKTKPVKVQERCYFEGLETVWKEKGFTNTVFKTIFFDYKTQVFHVYIECTGVAKSQKCILVHGQLVVKKQLSVSRHYLLIHK